MSTIPVSVPSVFFGVGFDTARYGHHVTFLRDDLQLACPPCEFAESRQGYDRVFALFQKIRDQAPTAHFHIRLDAAGQYAANLETFLRQLPFAKTITIGEPARNQNYRKALFPKRKADPVESLCAARFALLEKPVATAGAEPGYHHLREIVGRLEAQCRQATRLTNQLHNLLARVFPELPLIAADLQARWVLQLLTAYPTPAEMARVPLQLLTAIPFASADKARKLQAAAATTVASFRGDAAAALIRQLVGQLRDAIVAEEGLKDLMTAVYQQLPQTNHIDSIPGIGIATAAVLTAKIVDIERFATAGHVVAYFGVFPEEASSGVDKDGHARPGRQAHMSRKGNDLARKYLWNAAKCAITHNPAVRPLYRRLRARGVRGDVALGHCMRKLLHLVFAVWKSRKPFDPEHYPWDSPQPTSQPTLTSPTLTSPTPTQPPAAAAPNTAPNEKTASHNQGFRPERRVVTAVDSNLIGETPTHKDSLPSIPSTPASPPMLPAGGIDYAALRSQISMKQVLEHLGHLGRLKGSNAQRRGPCPIHDSLDAHESGDRSSHRCFSVNLDKNVFQCFHPPCGAHGNVLDFWAALHRLPLYDAARHLAETFHIGLDPAHGTGRGTRNGNSQHM